MSRPPRALRRSPTSPRLALVLAAVLAAGCGGKVVLDSSDGGLTSTGGPACDVTSGGTEVCEVLLSGPSSETQGFATACTSGGGMIVDACPTQNLLGTCTVSAGGLTLAVSFYSGSGLTSAAAQQACAGQGGMWMSS